MNTNKHDEALMVAFVQGAKWWEYQKTSATMWNSDQDLADAESEKRLVKGTLGVVPNLEEKKPTIT